MYSNKHNKESIQTLKYEMPLADFLDHAEFVDMISALEQEEQMKAEEKNKR